MCHMVTPCPTESQHVLPRFDFIFSFKRYRIFHFYQGDALEPIAKFNVRNLCFRSCVAGSELIAARKGGASGDTAPELQARCAFSLILQLARLYFPITKMRLAGCMANCALRTLWQDAAAAPNSRQAAVFRQFKVCPQHLGRGFPPHVAGCGLCRKASEKCKRRKI
jgi:hypothetical protein